MKILLSKSQKNKKKSDLADFGVEGLALSLALKLCFWKFPIEHFVIESD